MQIQSIITNYIFKQKNNDTQLVSKPKEVVNSGLMPEKNSIQLPTGSLAFKSVSNGEVLKKLLQYQIPDLYSDRIMLNPNFIQGVLKRKFFSSSIRTVVKGLIPYEDSLFPVEKNIFTILKNVSKNQPKKLIEDVIHELAPLHQTRLRNIQKPIFDELMNLSEEMPEVERKEFENLMDITYKKLENQPVKLDFSVKEFKYQLDRINEGIKSRNIKAEVLTMKKLIKMAKQMPTQNPEDYVEKISKNKNKKINKTKMIQNITRRKAEIVRQMVKVLSESSLKKDKELNDLFITARARIYKIPIIYSFKRKSFIHELEKITNKLTNVKLAHRMIQTALRLPTSKEDVSAFIMKAVDYSSEKIGYDMLIGSVGTIEHLVPAKRGGKNTLSNYALATFNTNNERALRPFEQHLKMHPEIYISAPKQIERLIELYNDGTFKKIGLNRGYIVGLVSKLLKMSPRENPLDIDISALKK